MSAINLSSEAPASIGTVEQAAFWLMSLLFDLNKGTTYKEAVGTSLDSGIAPLVDVSIVTAADGSTRAICRASFELDPAYVTDTSQKLWMFVQPYASTQVPPAYKVD